MAWNLTGNSDATTSSFLGTTNVQPLIIKTNAAEALRIDPDGKVSIGNLGGPRPPDYRLDVQGILNADEIYKGGVPLVQSQWTTVGGGITYDGGEVGIGARVSGYRLNVDGTLNATDVHKGGAPLVGSQWEDGESGGINYTGGIVGIGTINASYKLNVDGTINASEFRRNGSVVVSSQWTEVSGVGIRYNSYVGLGKAPASTYRLDVAGSINATDIHKNGTSVVSSQWTSAASGNISYSGGKVGIGTANPQGNLDVSGDIRAGNSDIYFTRTDHDHTGIGNTAGYAALENAANYGALMILGRAGTPQGRMVKLWDYLQVNGGMDVTGSVGIGTAGPTHRLHVRAADAVGLFESTGGQAYLRLSTNEGLDNRVEITNRPGGRLSLWTAGAGDVFNITRGGNVGIGTTSPGAKLSVTGGGATVNGVAVGTDVPGIDYPYEYETVGVTNPGYNLRLQSPNAIAFHTGDAPAQRMLVAENGDVTITGRLGTGNWSAQPRRAGWGGGIHTWDIEAEGTIWSMHGYTQGSDARMKTSVAELSNVLNKLDAFRGVSFEWIKAEAPAAQQRNIGVIAQEVEEAFPELVSEHGDERHKAVDYSGLTGILVEAAKELKAENEALENKLNARTVELRCALDEVRARIDALEPA